MNRLKISLMVLVLAVTFSMNTFAKDKDNNPPGRAGGPGTNWENAQGGKPRGWIQGEKKGWEGEALPPGLAKKTSETGSEENSAPPSDFKQKMDLNDDGVVDQHEQILAKNKWQEKKKEWIEQHSEMKAQMDANQDGAIDQTERQAAREAWKESHPMRQDFNGNPPGPAGGPGTNWQNPPGPQGGPGMGQDFRPDRDNNPPGPMGGQGTNWENPRGPVGGPGASPNVKRDRDNNPPGRAGGPGTNWENPRGPAGGPGASPNRKKR